MVGHRIKLSRHSVFLLGTSFWGMTGVPMNNSTPMETCPGVAR